MDLFTTNNEKKYSIDAKLTQGTCSSLHKFKRSKGLAYDPVKTHQTHFDESETLRNDEHDQTASISNDGNISIDDNLVQSISHGMQESKNTSSRVDLFLHLSDSKTRLKYYMFEDDISDHKDNNNKVGSNNYKLSSNISRQTRVSTEAHPYMHFLDLLDEEDFDED
mmetsp:Transcript_8901/g.17842  ORF Transcript_8901/g.17842 Transcript_8901/m.17842 type:complete len:166 (-) Transcript_8901:88-585(-)